MTAPAAPQLPQSFQIRPISDLRTRLPEIESAVAEGASVVMNRNGKPVLLIQDYASAMRDRELERHAQKLREAEIWDRACGSARASLDDVLAVLSSDRDEFSRSGLGGAHA
ncbi:MAG: type II toxin-antitoxin system Phd/YefM family antitoxin [Coriobacteriia bacterium]|nr:type II toxin-antitoxin system Phd/YefM family antitoxin [Coriobacteriia bacterium]